MPARHATGPLRNVLQLRLNHSQYAFLVLESRLRGLGQAEIVRQLVDAAIDSAPPLPIGEDADGGEMPLRLVLEGADPNAIDDLAAAAELALENARRQEHDDVPIRAENFPR